MKDTLKILVYGYGNPGRQDDGLGVSLAETMEIWAGEKGLKYLQTDTNYQLNIEDALRIANFDLVIFADASQEDMEGYVLTPLEPSARMDFTMHAVSPAFVLNLCHEVYHKKPRAFLLHMRGYEWEFMEKMTQKAGQNLDDASKFLKEWILDFMAAARHSNKK